MLGQDYGGRMVSSFVYSRIVMEFKYVLVLAPHTDDGELGARGFISKLIAQLGLELNVLLVDPVGYFENVGRKVQDTHNLYGGGKAAQRIVDIILKAGV